MSGTPLYEGLHLPLMEYKNAIFQAWKVMEFNCWSLKGMENESSVW